MFDCTFIIPCFVSCKKSFVPVDINATTDFYLVSTAVVYFYELSWDLATVFLTVTQKSSFFFFFPLHSELFDTICIVKSLFFCTLNVKSHHTSETEFETG